MEELDKKIIEIIKPAMQKDLVKGCIVNDTDYGTGLAEIFAEYSNRNWIMLRYDDLSKPYIERKKDVEDWETIGIYELLAIENFVKTLNIGSNIFTGENGNKVFEIFHKGGKETFHFPNKSLYSYSEEEKQKILDFLEKCLIVNKLS